MYRLFFGIFSSDSICAYFLTIQLFFVATHATLPPVERRKFCEHQAPLRIESAHDSGEKTIVYFSHSGRSYRAEGTFRPEKPRDLTGVTTIGQLPQGLTPSTRYLFLFNISGYVLKEIGANWRFMGYNQDWIACPQSLCLDGTLDAAFDNIAHVVFLSGAFFWKTRNTGLSPTAPLMGSHEEIQGVKYVDAAVCEYGWCYLVKDGNLYSVQSDDLTTSVVSNSPFMAGQCLKRETGAAVVYSDHEFFFSDTTFCSGDSKDSRTMNLPAELHNLDAAFLRRGQLYLVKRWTYFRIRPIPDGGAFTIPSPSGPSSVFRDLFGCNEAFYARLKLGSLSEYQRNMTPLLNGQGESEWNKYTTPSDRTGNSTLSGASCVYLIDFGAIIFVAAIIVVVSAASVSLSIHVAELQKPSRSPHVHKERTFHRRLLWFHKTGVDAPSMESRAVSPGESLLDLKRADKLNKMEKRNGRKCTYRAALRTVDPR